LTIAIKALHDSAMNTPSSPSETSRSCLKDYAKAERQVRQGKRLVITGFFVALIGAFLYCGALYRVDANQQLSSTVLQANTEWSVIASLGIVGVGVLLWIVGAIVHFIGGVNSDPSGPDLYF
jgi:hypothetical protein